MSVSKESTGIIYMAKNKVSGKAYVGKTLQLLKTRVIQHFSNSKRSFTKFSNALRKYPKSSWEWSILSKIPLSELDEYEVFFITDLDTVTNGYNTIVGNYSLESKKNVSPSSSPNTIYEVYHCDYGHISVTKGELREINPYVASYISDLISERQLSLKGWILSKNYKSYVPTNIITLFHSEYGNATLTRKEFKEKFKLTSNDLYSLISLKRNSRKGWQLLKNEKSN